MKRIVTLAVLLVVLNGCASNLGTIRTDEAHQTSALRKVDSASKEKDKAVQAKLGAIANIGEQVRILLKAPETSKTVPVAFQLLDEQLALTGAPTERESVLEKEVAELQATQQENEAALSEIQKRDKAAEAALDAANADIAKYKTQVVTTTAKLYSAAEFTATQLDEWNNFENKLWFVGVSIAVVGVGLFVFYIFTKFGISTAVATTAVASKIP